jgi:alkylation response protein AidB-like acyl-CoA dehydrogenase
LDTLIATSADLAGDQAVIACAEAVRAAVAAASNEIESTRRLPPALLDQLHAAGLFRLLLPRSSNGIETDPLTFFHVIETIARADASTAWCLSQAGGCAMSAGLSRFAGGACDLRQQPARGARLGPRSEGQGDRVRRRLQGFRESIVPRTGDTQFFLYDPDGVGVELNFPKA